MIAGQSVNRKSICHFYLFVEVYLAFCEKDLRQQILERSLVCFSLFFRSSFYCSCLDQLRKTLSRILLASIIILVQEWHHWLLRFCVLSILMLNSFAVLLDLLMVVSYQVSCCCHHCRHRSCCCFLFVFAAPAAAAAAIAAVDDNDDAKAAVLLFDVAATIIVVFVFYIVSAAVCGFSVILHP